MKRVFVVEAKRTAIGRFLGGLESVKPGEMASQVIKNIVTSTNLDTSKIDEVILGHQHSAGQGPSIARRAQIEAGIPAEVPAVTINMQCGSGMKSIILGYNSIQAGSNIVLCGGVEVMSQVPFIMTNKVRKGVKMGNDSVNVQDSLFCDGLIDQFNNYPMGVTAENVAEKIGVSRQDQDEFALRSQTLSIKAVDSGRFNEEVVPIVYKDRRGNEIIFNKDESMTRGTTLEGLSELRTVFKKDGTVTAGNSSQLSDGGSIVLIASEDAVKENNFKPLGEIIATSQTGIDPSIMGLGPVNSIKKVLEKSELSLKDIDLIELNEAFAAQSLGVVYELERIYGIDRKEIMKKTNVNGGAIALGHPVAASGSRIVATLLYEMKKRSEAKYGIASICMGGGMGAALLLKKCY